MTQKCELKSEKLMDGWQEESGFYCPYLTVEGEGEMGLA